MSMNISIFITWELWVRYGSSKLQFLRLHINYTITNWVQNDILIWKDWYHFPLALVVIEVQFFMHRMWRRDDEPYYVL